MIKKSLFMFTFCLTAFGQASAQSEDCDSLQRGLAGGEGHMLTLLQPTHIRNVSEAANWGNNWFLELKGGASAFLGSPIGCGDVFDRLTPAFQAGIGKWFTPAIGGRVEYQGFKFRNGRFDTMRYHFVHADFLYNVTSGIWQNEKGLSKWDIIPYLGVGMIYNPDWNGNCHCPADVSGRHPFAFSYGFEARYRLGDNLHLVAAISAMTTGSHFDNVGVSTRFGDHILAGSLGLSLSIGKTGWKPVTDAQPYIEQNKYLLDYIGSLQKSHARQQKNNSDGSDKTGVYPRNSYSGLNSLRARLSGQVTSGRMEEGGFNSGYGDGNGLSGYGYGLPADSLGLGVHSQVTLGVPVYFFFQMNSDSLVDNSQLVNLDEIARIAKENGFCITISGAADSATGSSEINSDLSRRRAAFIASELMKRGIDKGSLRAYSHGGIDKYVPAEANRFTMVMLTKK